MKNYKWKRCKHYTKHLKTIKAYIECLYKIDGCCSGGILHTVLDDDNLDDDSILFCLGECLQQSKREEANIGRLICEELLRLSLPERRLLVEPISDFQCLLYPDEGCDNCFIETGEEE